MEISRFVQNIASSHIGVSDYDISIDSKLQFLFRSHCIFT